MNKGEKRSRANFNILNKIREERNKRGWTDYELAENCEIAQSTISTWYNREIEPGVASIEKICSGFGISLSEFFRTSEALPTCLTAEQQEILSLWSKLSPDQRTAVTGLIKSFIEH